LKIYANPVYFSLLLGILIVLVSDKVSQSR